MAVADVKKIRIVTHKNDKDKVVDFLYGAGFMEITKWQGKAEKFARPVVDETLNNLDYRLSEIQFSINFLNDYLDKEKVGLVERFTGSSIAVTAKKINEILKKIEIDKVVKDIKEIEEKINKSKAKIDSIDEENELLSKWVQLDMKISEAKETDYIKVLFATVESEKYLDLLRNLDKKVAQIDIRKVSSEDQRDYLLVIFNKKFEKQVGKIFFRYGAEKAELPEADTTPENLIKQNKEKKTLLKKKIKKSEKKAKKIAGNNLKDLKILFDYHKWNSEKLAAEQNFVETGSVVIINGWIEESNIDSLEKGLDKISKNSFLETVKPAKGESSPVVIKNSDFMKPFEAVTGIYGLPKKTEVDPTPFLSVFFIIFFGLCLTDAGYGLVLMTLTYLAIKVLKIPRENQKLIRLLMYGGFVTFIIGALTGGWFGIVIDDLPDSLGFIKTALNAIKLVDPVNDPITMLILSFVLGYIQIWFGIAIDMWWKIKNNKLIDGLLDSGTWLYFLSAIAFYGVTAFGLLPESLRSIAFYMLISGVVLIVLTQGRQKKNILMKLVSGIGSLYGLVGYMSDILSYSRLLALGLATAVIAMVINLIAIMFKDMVPVVGWVIMILILIGGHLFNIVINVLGAYIHSGRLQFVEFFPKFFKGGGRIFKPFRRESKYVNLNIKEN